MRLLSRLKTALRSNANSAADRSSDPAKDLDRAIRELEETHQAAMKELLDYKSTAKRMDQDLARLGDEVELWDKRARAAVKKGQDDLAKKCLREKKQREGERASIERDKNEAEGYAAELDKSRKQAETRLKMLKMRKGTMAAQIASARSGQSSVFGGENELFEQMDKAEERIDEGAAAAEVSRTMASEELDAAEASASLDESSSLAQTDTALAELKAKVSSTGGGSQRERTKELGPGPGGEKSGA